MNTVKDCLGQKPSRVVSVRSTDTIQKALELMKVNRVRAVLVIDDDKLAGIVSQGDCAIRALLPGWLSMTISWRVSCHRATAQSVRFSLVRTQPVRW